MHRRFHAALSAAGLLAALTALWSITRVKPLVGDYAIFWLSAVGTLNRAVVGALALARVAVLVVLMPLFLVQPVVFSHRFAIPQV